MCIINPVPDKPLSRTVLKNSLLFQLELSAAICIFNPFHTDQLDGGKNPIASGTISPVCIAGRNRNCFKHFQHSPASLHMRRGGSAECHTQVFSQLGLVQFQLSGISSPIATAAKLEGTMVSTAVTSAENEALGSRRNDIINTPPDPQDTPKPQQQEPSTVCYSIIRW